MKKIHRKILGFNPIIHLDNNISKLCRSDWFGNSVKPIDLNKIPDQYEEELFDRISNTRILNIYKDSSDSNEDSNGNSKGLDIFLKSPKKTYLDKFDSNNNRIERKIETPSEIESITEIEYDKNNNLIKLSYNRLGYTQHYVTYKYNIESNLVEIVFYKDISHGKEEFEPETKSTFTYDKKDEYGFKRLDYKYQENSFIERSKTNTIIRKDEDDILEVETSMHHLRTGSKGRTLRKYDSKLNQIANYSFIENEYHPHSVDYVFEYDEYGNWVTRNRIRKDGPITLKSKQTIEYL